MYSAGNVTTYGVALPKGKITSDILLCCIFEVKNVDPRLKDLTYQVYLAHEAHYTTTRSYRAFGEGPLYLQSGNGSGWCCQMGRPG